MNAVIDKPLAKAKPKALRPALPGRIRSVLDRIRISREKFSLALELTEPGSATEITLNQLCLSWLPTALEPLFRTPLTKVDAEAAYDALRPSLATIEAVIALAAGTVIEHTLREGQALLDAAHSELDICGALTKLLPDGPSEAAAAEASFNQGRDLAIRMLVIADTVQSDDPDGAAPYRAYRDGKEQRRFTEAFLLQLVADPRMLAGFNAVLSAKLSDQCYSQAAFYARSMAEYSAGEIGADGTVSNPSNEGSAHHG